MILPKKLLTLFVLFLLLGQWLAVPAFAQTPESEEEVGRIDWRELESEEFLIVYAESVEIDDKPVDCACGVAQAERYTAFVDDIYHDLAVLFEAELPTPINLRLFPTEASYYQVNPVAERLTGVIAHALNNRAEIAIAAPRTAELTEDELVNSMRHELTHFFASALSDGKLTAGFQEGVAQYLEKPDDRTASTPSLLRQAQEQGRLLTWAELDRAKDVYSDPQVAYPQSLSIISFLVDRYGLPNLLRFLRASAVEPGYRAALESAYGKPADALEAEWLAYLPEYIDGRWQINAIYTYDLSRVTELVNQGAYTDAETELAEIIALLESTNQADTLARAEALLAQAHQGRAAGALVDETRQALEANDYALTLATGNAAIQAYEALGYPDRIQEVQVYMHRAELGQQALDRLHRGEQLIKSFRFLQADNELHEATRVLQSLNNQAAAQQGIDLLAQSAQKQSLLAYALLAVGLALIFFNILRRLLSRYSANPAEVDFP